MSKIKYVPGMAVTFDSEEEAEEFCKIIKKILPVTWCPFVYYKENVLEKRVVWGRVDDNSMCHRYGIHKFSDLEFEEKIEYTVEELWNYIFKLAASVEKGGMTIKMMREAYMPEEYDVGTTKVLTNLTPDEFVKKSREYYNSIKPIKPGTIVKSNKTGRTGILVSDDGYHAEIFTKSGSDKGYRVYVWPHNNLEVTDRYISGFAAFIEMMDKEEEIWKTEIDG